MILQWVLLVLTVGTLGAYSGLLFVMLAVMMLVVVMLLLSLVVVVVVVCVCVCACFYACICRFVSKRCIPVVMNFRRK